ncbi:hypothetical protein ZWY2020_019178 [Hordeum vulgare]|nr:hypothetical protein ZWY2020_019178 [Hordeum vulgare]
MHNSSSHLLPTSVAWTKSSSSARRGLHDVHQPEEDRLSMLMDDILLSILGRLDLRTAARMSALSARWRHLPWLLPEINIDVQDFLPIPRPKPIEAMYMDKAMASVIKATRAFLVNRHGESIISTLHLKIYPIDASLCEVGPLLSDAIESGFVKDLDLAVLYKRNIWFCSEEGMLNRGQPMDGFFSAYSNVLHCLTRLSLYTVRFEKLDMHHLLFDCCKQLKHLGLYHCDITAHSLSKIDAPNSKLLVLKLAYCRFEILELVCLPKLEKLKCNTWVTRHAPLAFGYVPSLGELELSHGLMHGENEFKLSELLHGSTCIHTLTLGFKGETNELVTQTQVWEHICDLDDKTRQLYAERRRPLWELHSDGLKNRFLKELQFTGFRSLEHQFTFISAMLERAPNLQLVVLKGDERCHHCDALDTPQRTSKFPKKDEQEMVVRRIQDGKFSPQIVFDE